MRFVGNGKLSGVRRLVYQGHVGSYERDRLAAGWPGQEEATVIAQ